MIFQKSFDEYDLYSSTEFDDYDTRIKNFQCLHKAICATLNRKKFVIYTFENTKIDINKYRSKHSYFDEKLFFLHFSIRSKIKKTNPKNVQSLEDFANLLKASV